MLVAYPALFYYDETEATKYFVHFPDIENSATQGVDIPDALKMASEYLGITIAAYMDSGDSVPTPSKMNELELTSNHPFKNDDDFTLTYDPDKSFISMVYVDINPYLGSDNPIKKTLTIPKWADELGKKHALNFSHTLTEAIVEKTSKDIANGTKQ